MNTKPKQRSGFNWKQKDKDKDPKSRDRDRDDSTKKSKRRDEKARNRSLSPRQDQNRNSRERDDRYDTYRDRSSHSPRRPRTKDTDADDIPPQSTSIEENQTSASATKDERPDSELTEEELADRRMREIFGASEVAAYEKAEASKPTSTAPAKKEKARKDPKPAAAPAGSEPTIVVNVNDRLGRKAAIPMLPSDKISHLKVFVAAMLGLQEGTFVIKRQGMAPFKDHISLADYEITHGVQLDLEPAK